MKRGSSGDDEGGGEDDARKKNKVSLLPEDEEAGFAALVSTTITLVELRRVCERLGLPTGGSQQVLRSAIATRLAEEKSLDNVPASARTARGVEPLKGEFVLTLSARFLLTSFFFLNQIPRVRFWHCLET